MRRLDYKPFNLEKDVDRKTGALKVVISLAKIDSLYPIMIEREILA